MINIKKVITSLIIVISIVAISLSGFWVQYCNAIKNNIALSKELDNTKNDMATLQDELNSTKDELSVTQENLQTEIYKSSQLNIELNNLRDELNRLNDKFNKTVEELNSAKEQIAYLDKHSGAHNGWSMCWRETNLEQWEIDFFAKLLYSEAGIMGYEGQFWVASAILNLSERTGMSIWDMGHKVNMFAVAPIVDSAKPTQQQYDIIYEVLNNGWIADVAFFRTDYPHSFGKFMVQIENVCFNSP